MKTAFKSLFFKDVKKGPVTLHPELDNLITKLEKVRSLKEIANLKKLKGHDTATE